MTQKVAIHPAAVLARQILTFTTVAELIDQIDEQIALQLFAHAILLSSGRSQALVDTKHSYLLLKRRIPPP